MVDGIAAFSISRGIPVAAMLYYGSERVMSNEVPEVNITPMHFGVRVECNAGDCNWYADAVDNDEAEEFVAEHQQWHEDGMPQ